MEWQAAAGAVGGLASAYGAHKANKANQALAREQMAFQERMSSTAHQRQVKDMKKAGLNPVLSATHGGASTTQGAMPQMKNVAENASSSAINFMTGLKQIEKMDAEINNTKADTAIKDPKATVYGEAGNFISKGIDAIKENFSAKSLKNRFKSSGVNMDKQLLRMGKEASSSPITHSAKQKFKSMKTSITNKYNQYKNKFNKMFGN